MPGEEKLNKQEDDPKEEKHDEELLDEELDEVVGGAHEIVSPRDPASGLPTGKRMHKPLT
jgi:hypothetical protein